MDGRAWHMSQDRNQIENPAGAVDSACFLENPNKQLHCLGLRDLRTTSSLPHIFPTCFSVNFDTRHRLSSMATTQSESREARSLRFLRKGINANFIVECQGQEWRVDKAMLAVKSPYFEALTTRGFRVSLSQTANSATICQRLTSFKEAAEGKVVLNQEEPEVIDQILIYIYTSTYDDLAVLPELSSSLPQNIRTQSTPPSDPESGLEADVPSEDSNDQYYDGLEDVDPVMFWEVATARPVQTRLNNASEAEVTSVLKTGVRLYECARWMGLEELATEAASTVMKRELYWPSADISEFLEVVFSATQNDDDQIRIPVLQRCLANQLAIEAKPTLLEVVKKWEPTAWQFGVNLRVECTAAASELSKATRQINKKKAKVRRLIRDNDALQVQVHYSGGQTMALTDQNMTLTRDLDQLKERYQSLESRKRKTREDFLDVLQMKGRVLCPICKKHRKITDAGKRDEHGKRMLKCRKGHLMVSVRQEG